MKLLADEKERAEHIMLVDLGRNDIGRVCERGTVRVTEQMVVERYSHVMHIVSNVVGKLAEGKDAFDVLRASFPAGTVSGAPKVRAMEIIDEMEPVRRGPLFGRSGVFRFWRKHGYLHRDTHALRARRHALPPGGGGCRGGLKARFRIRGNHQQGPRLPPRSGTWRGADFPRAENTT